MVLAQPFTTASPALVNYDSTDVSNGTGYEDYYLIESEDSTGKDYHLTPNPDYSNSASVFANSGQTPIDYDYDLTPFTIARIINGTVLISIAAQATGISPTWTLELYKWDGAAETILGTAVTYAGVIAAVRMLYFRMPIDNKLIAAGETLRLRILLANPHVSQVFYGIDPAGRTDATLTITTTSKISIPFKLDI